MLKGKREAIRRGTAWVLTACLTMGMFSGVALADNESGDSGDGKEMIRLLDFEELDDAVASQEIPSGTPVKKLNLPSKLTGSREKASSSDLDSIRVPVKKWESDPNYDEQDAYEEGEIFTFTPVFGAHYDVGGTELPEITVTIVENSAEEPSEEPKEEQSEEPKEEPSEEPKLEEEPEQSPVPLTLPVKTAADILITVKINDGEETGAENLEAAVALAWNDSALDDITNIEITGGEITTADWKWFNTNQYKDRRFACRPDNSDLSLQKNPGLKIPGQAGALSGLYRLKT